MSFFFLNDPATTEIYPLPLHDPLPISSADTFSCDASALRGAVLGAPPFEPVTANRGSAVCRSASAGRSEEHTSELQSHSDLVCRLLLEKKKKPINIRTKSSSLSCAAGY